MSVSVTKPVVAASLVASTIVYIGYLWYKNRAGEGQQSSVPAPDATTGHHLEQVQQKLQSVKRSRLETLEEEPTSTEHLNQDEILTNSDQDRTKTEPSEEIPVVKEVVEVNDPVEDCGMAVEESPIGPVPDVLSALNDPLCVEHDGYTSSSPVKSESAQSKSSCEWSDLIEQDMKEMQEFQLDSRELTCKLSGLELAGSGRSTDR